MDDARKTKAALIAELRRLRMKAKKLGTSGKRRTSAGRPTSKSARTNASGRDIAPRKRLEAGLRESEERYRLLFENSGEAILMTQPDGSVVSANPEACRIFGRTEDEIKKLGRAGLIDNNDPRLKAALEERKQTGKFIGELNLLRKDGMVFPAEVSTTAFTDSLGIVRTTMIIRDITERLSAEQAGKRVDLELLSARRRVKEAHRLAHIGTWDWVMENDTVTWSEEMYNIAGRDPSLPAPTYGEHPRIYTPASWDCLSSAVTRALTSGEPYDLELELVRPDGSTRWTSAFGGATRDGNGKTIGLHGTLQDITERKQAEEKVQENESRFRAFVEQAPVAIGVWNLDGTALYANQKYLETLGLQSIEEIVGRPAAELFAPQFREESNERTRRRLQGLPVPAEYESIALRADGSQFPMHMAVAPIQIAGGIKSIAFMTDLTDRKQAEKLLQESEGRLRDIIFSVGDWVWEVDEHGVYTYSSQKGFDLFGPDRQNVLGKTPFDFMPPAEAKRVGAIFSELAANKLPIRDLENWNISNNGDHVCLLTNGVPILDEQGNLKGYRGVDKDITERKRAETRLKQALEWQDAIFEGSRDAVFVSDGDSRFVAVNNAAIELTGCSREQLLTMRIPDLHDHPDLDAYKFYHQRIFGGEEILSEAKILRKDGTKVDTEFNNRCVWIAGKPYMHTTARDITGRKGAEEALKDVNAKLNRAQRIAHIGSWSNYLPTNQLEWSEEMNRIFGLTAGVPMTLTDVIRVFPPEELERFQQAVGAAINANAPYSMDYKIIRSDGSLRYIHDEGEVVRDEQGKAIWMHGTTQDITEHKHAEEELALLAHTIRSISECVSVTDQENNILFVNDAFLKTYGYTRDELLGKPISIVRSTAPEPAVEDVLRETFRGGWRGELLNRKKDGTEFPIALFTSVVFNEKGEPIALVGIAADITERKRAEQLIVEERNLLRSIINAIPDEIVVKDLERRFVLANEGCLRALGKQALDQVVGLRDEDLIPDRFVRDVRDKENRVLASGETLFNDIPEPRRNPNTGKLERVIMSTKTPLHDRSGCIVGLVTVNRNVTELQITLEALRESESRFRTVWDNTLDGMRLTDAEGTIVMVNQSYCHLFKRESEELIGSPMANTYLPIPDENIVERYRERFRSRAIAPFLEAEVALWNGEKLSMEISNAFLYVPDQPELLLSAFRDITERKRAEEALARTRDDLRRTLELVPDMICTASPEGHFLSVNPAFERILGHSKEQLLATSYLDLMHPEDRESTMVEVGKQLDGRSTVSFENRYRCKDGTYKVLEWHAAPAEGGVLFAVARDITERKRAEEALRKSATNLAGSQRVGKLGSWDWNIAENSLSWSDETYRIWGVGTTFPLTFDSIAGMIHPDDRELNSKKVQELLATQNEGSYEFRIICPDGTVKCIYQRVEVTRAPSGQPIRVFGIMHDITERKQAEERLMTTQEQLHSLAGHLQSVREEERKHLAQEFHDQLGQTLTAIKMDLSMLHRAFANPSKEPSRSVIAQGLESTQDMIDRAIAIIREILSELRPELLDQLGIVPTLEWEVERFQQKSGIACTFSSTVEAVALDAKNAIALYRIFQEAVTNVARHAMAKSVEVTLQKEGAELVLAIVDNGKGISADAQRKAHSFGLIGMRERAILLGGTLEIRGVEGKGTTILVRIPYVEAQTHGSVPL